MRGLAVLVVVAFHAGLQPLAGGFVGVDVFYVISGFLITGLLVDELRRTGSVSLTGFYARRVRRLLPLASLVLVAVAVTFRPLLAPIDWPGLGRELLAAALWSANWQFASTATDYLGDVSHSPVLHYWSLSVEEQFYLLWPLLILAVAGRRRAGARPGRVRRLAVALALLGAGSLLASLLTTRSAGPWAYFGLHTRGWELAAGGLLALGRPAAAGLPRRVAVPAGWAGLALIGGAVLGFDRSTAFPGTAALVPVGGAVLVLLSGTARTARGGPGRLLALPPLGYVGRISYAWYLWHWPCLVAARLWNAPTDPGADPDLPAAPPGTSRILLAVVASFLLAVLSHRLVEQPVRRARPLARSRGLSLAVGAGVLMVAVAGPALALRLPPVPAPATTAAAAAEPAAAGPAASAPAPAPAAGTPVTGAAAFPTPGPQLPRMTPQQARDDQVRLPGCFLGFTGSVPGPGCVFGDAQGDRVVVALGDSHLEHWFPALQRVAAERHWRLYLWAKSGCGYSAVPQWLAAYSRFYTECAAWRQAVLDRIHAMSRVDAVIVGRSGAQLSKLTDPRGHRLPTTTAVQRWGAGAREVLRTLAADAGRVVLLRDVPRPLDDVPACLSAHPGHAERCDYPRAGRVLPDTTIFAGEQPVAAAAGVHVVDLTGLVCSTDPCPVVSPSGTVIFRDGHHLTATFAREATAGLADRLVPAVTG